VVVNAKAMDLYKPLGDDMQDKASQELDPVALVNVNHYL